MSAGEVLGAVVGFGVMAFLLFGIVVLVIGGFEVVSDALASFKDRANAIQAQRAHERLRAGWAAERATAETRHVVAAFDESSPVLTAGAAGDLLVTGHLNGDVRLRDISEDGESVGGFATGHESGIGHAAVSPDGRFVATSRRFDPDVEVRLADGRFLGRVVPDSATVADWQAGANDLDGYLLLNRGITGFVFGPSEQGASFTVAWNLQYGPDGGPSPNFGSSAVLVRRLRLREDGPPETAGEILHDISHQHPFGRWSVIMPDGSLIRGRAGSVEVISALSNDVKTLREDVGWPLASTPDGRLIVSRLAPDGDPEPYYGLRRVTFSLWDTRAGERRGVWNDTALSFGPAVSVSPDGRLFAVEARELYPAPGRSNFAGYERTRIRIYEMEAGALKETLPVEPRFLIFAPRGDKLLAVEAGGVTVWRV